MFALWHKYDMDYVLYGFIELSIFICLFTLSGCIVKFDSVPPTKPTIEPIKQTIN
jgi:hypothetical protein